MIALHQAMASIDWVTLTPDHDDWHASRCVYAYIAADQREILYIGMTWDQTVHCRWTYSAKPEFWDYLRYRRGIGRHIALVGHIELAARRRLSKTLLTDIESLLITQLQPCGNIQATVSRISRPGMLVHCLGPQWPGPSHFYER